MFSKEAAQLILDTWVLLWVTLPPQFPPGAACPTHAPNCQSVIFMSEDWFMLISIYSKLYKQKNIELKGTMFLKPRGIKHFCLNPHPIPYFTLFLIYLS